MFATIIMDDKKDLYKTTTPTIYNQENNADKILILLPEYYGDLNLKDCSVTLNWIQPQEQNITTELSGNIKLLTFENELFKNKYLQSITPITITETSVAGQAEIFLEINSPINNSVIKTGSTFLEIKKHKDITDYISEEQLSLLSDYQIKMQQMMNTANQVLTQATVQADRAKQYADIIVKLMKEWEDKYGA